MDPQANPDLLTNAREVRRSINEKSAGLWQRMLAADANGRQITTDNTTDNTEENDR